jgi:ribosomal-protein-alanine N-acetyltransferase
MYVLETDRLRLRRFTIDDAEFILDLLNQPSFLRHIGDKGVRTSEGAREYILDGPLASYEKNGFGLYMVELKSSEEEIGMCGLVNREALEDIDIGFAFLPQFWGRGYAVESASAVVNSERQTLGLDRIVAITSPDNDASIRVLERIGMRFERMVRLPDDESEIKLFSWRPRPA